MSCFPSGTYATSLSQLPGRASIFPTYQMCSFKKFWFVGDPQLLRNVFSALASHLKGSSVLTFAISSIFILTIFKIKGSRFAQTHGSSQPHLHLILPIPSAPLSFPPPRDLSLAMSKWVPECLVVFNAKIKAICDCLKIGKGVATNGRRFRRKS
jgi:hypothetical protein